MLVALLDGRSLPAGELARAAAVNPSTARAGIAQRAGRSSWGERLQGFQSVCDLVAATPERMTVVRPPSAPASRALHLTPDGRHRLAQMLDIDQATLHPATS